MSKLLLVALALALAPPAFAQPPRPPVGAALDAKDLAEINEILKSLKRAWNTHDPAEWARLFHPDGTWVLWTGGAWQGRTVIEAQLREPFLNYYSQSTQTWHSHPEIRRLAADVVVIRALSRTTGDSRQPGVTIYGNQMLVLTRRNGVWGILYGQNTRLNEAEVAKLK